MIGVENQYSLSFSIGDQIDFIAENELFNFALIEDAGNTLPTFQLSFITPNEKILAYLHEGNDLKVSFGRTNSSAIDSLLTPTKVESNRVGENRRQITIAGIYSSLAYLGNSNLFISDKLSAIEVLISVVSKYFKVESNIEKSLDKQHWVQPNQSDRAFVNTLWLRADLGDSFPAVGVTSDGRFIIKDVLKSLNEDYKWRFTTAPTDLKRDILYDTDPVFSFDTGLVNNWVGYSREKLVYDLESGSTSFVKEVAENTLSNVKELVKRKGIEKRFAAIGVTNNNVHDNYWVSYQKNLTNLASFGGMKLTLSFSGEFKPIAVLDRVSYSEDSISPSSTGLPGAAEYHSGEYLVSKVSRSITNRQLTTLVQLVREAPNSIKVVS